MAKPKFIQIIEDIAYATIGGENTENRKKQFEDITLPTYIFAALVGIAVFVAIIALIVSLLL